VRSTAPTRGFDSFAAFGPAVKIVNVTAVVPAPAAIVVGLNPQLANAGNPEHAKLTAELNAVPPTATAENVYVALCPANTVPVGPPVSVHVTSVPTVSDSVGVACVNIPSVPWIVKLNAPVVALPSVKVNTAPPDVGVSVAGTIPQVVGAPAVHVKCTLPLYPFTEVSVPFQVTF
jgi:hypothetical protein